MVRIAILLGLLLMSLWSLSQPTFESTFPLKWKTKIGVTTYRTNMLFHEGLLYIGSNGQNRDSKFDAQDGVYAIHPKTGEIVYHFQIPFGGDNDVTGIAIGDGKLFFGTDNYYFFCFDLKTKSELWKYHLPYDVESKPVIADFNGDKKMDVAFTVQSNGIYALDGSTGTLIWNNNTISCHEGNAAPRLFDINKDGVMDILFAGRGEANSDEISGFKMAHYGDYHIAIDGKTGNYIWAVETGAGVHTAPFISTKNGKTEIYALDCYGELNVISPEGKVLKKANFDYGMFSSPVVTTDGHLIIGNTYAEIGPKAFSKENDTLPLYLNEEALVNVIRNKGKTSATSVVADVLGKGFPQVIGITESGEIFITKTDGTLMAYYHNAKSGFEPTPFASNSDGKSVAHLVHLNGILTGSETSLFVSDIDADGKLEIVIADLNGYLYCFDTKSAGKVEYGGF